MTQITKDQLESAVELIINTRDFCGNEFEAVKDFAHENGLNARQLMNAALPKANEQWRAFQKAAGVPQKYYRY